MSPVVLALMCGSHRITLEGLSKLVEVDRVSMRRIFRSVEQGHSSGGVAGSAWQSEIVAFETPE